MIAVPLVPNFASHVHTKPHAHSIGPTARKEIALEVLSGGKPTHIAEANDVSRKFVYAQVDIAKDAVDTAFNVATPDDEKGLFTVVVTKTLLRRMILALLLRCHAPYRGVLAFLEEIFGYSSSLGSIHNIVRDATLRAGSINSSIGLDGIKVGLHDEIYQNGLPVLVGVDSHSMFCYLLANEEHCDGTTWGYHLLTLQEKGFAPDSIVADQGKGHRAGLKEVYPNVPCFADVFHILKDFGEVIRFYENRSASATQELRKVETKMLKLQLRYEKQSKFSRTLGVARAKHIDLFELTSALKTLFDWLRLDILSIAGPCFEIRLELLNFVIDELQKREAHYPKVSSFRKKLENAKMEVLGFVDAVDSKLRQASSEQEMPLDLLEKIAIMLNCADSEPHRYKIEAEVRSVLRSKFYTAVVIVKSILESTPRASSLVESVNSLLRNYFFLRREIGHGYTQLLQFYLNHRVFTRSDRSHRVGKTPREVLTGQKHENWLDMLGFPKVKQAV
jgi:hypothetical protein